MNTYSIGIDIGGTNTDIGLVRDDGQVMAKKNLPTNKYFDADLYVSDIYDQIELLMQENGIDAIEGIGIAAPVGNYYTGCIENASNLNFKGIVDLKALFKAHIDVPVVVSNDANAAAYGELIYGGAKGMKHFIMFTLGTGVGSGIVVNGQMVYGHDGFAGELGHVIVKRTNGRVCGCGRTGCLEAYCSATGVARTAREFLELRDEPSKLREYDIEAITSKDVYDCAVAGDKLAKDIFEYTGNILGEALADFTNFSSPEAFVLFGGLTKSGDLIMNPVKEAFDRNVLGIYKGKVKILISELKESDAAVLGASALGWEVKE